MSGAIPTAVQLDLGERSPAPILPPSQAGDLDLTLSTPMRGWALLAARLCQAPIGFVTLSGIASRHTAGVDTSVGPPRRASHERNLAADAAARRAIVSGRPVGLDDTDDDWDGQFVIEPGSPPIRAVLAAPVSYGHGLRAAAVVGVLDTRARCWRAQPAHALTTLATSMLSDHRLRAAAARHDATAQLMSRGDRST